MRKKKYWALLVIALIIAVLTVGLVSCKKPVVDPPEEETEDWLEYLNVVGAAFDNTYSVNFSKAFNIDAELKMDFVADKSSTAASFDKVLKLSTNVNFSNLNTAGSNLFALEYGDKNETDANKKFGIYADNVNIFVNIYGTKFKIENAEVFNALNNLIGTVYDVDTKIAGIKDYFYAVGLLCFDDGKVNADKTVYSFQFSLAKIAEVVLPLLDGVLDEQTRNELYGMFGAADGKELMTKLPLISGNLDFHVAGDKFTGVGVSSIKYDNAAESQKGVFNAKLDVKSFGNGAIEGLSAKMPLASDESYTSAKIGSFRGNGSMDFMTDNNSFVTYDWTLDSNLDIIRIAAGLPIPEDNYFHFRLSHTCSDTCGAYCASKYRKGDGAIIDIGFSPKDFGTEYIYASISLQALLGPGGVEVLAPGYGNILPLAVPDYSLFTIDTSAFAYASSAFNVDIPQVVPTADTDLDISAIVEPLKIIMGVIKNSSVNAGGQSVTLGIGEILKGMGQGATLDTVNQLIGTPTTPLDQIKLSVDEMRFNDTQGKDIDLYQEVVYTKGPLTPGVKNYISIVSGDRQNVDWKVKSRENGSPKIFVSPNRSDKNELPNYVLTPYEANNMIGNRYLDFTFKKIGTDAFTADTATGYRTKITGINGIDYTKLNVEQNVKFMAAVPSDYISGMVKDALVSLVDLDSILYVVVDGKITLTEEIEFKFEVLEKENTFMLGEDIDTWATYSYAKMVDGQKIVVTGKSEGWGPTIVWNNDKARVGKIGNQKVDYNVIGRKFSKDIIVEAPFNATTYFQHTELAVVYETDSKNDKIFNYGNVTFSNEDGTKSYKMNLGLEHYTMPKSAVHTSTMNILAGTTTYGVYFNKIDANTAFKVDLFGYKTVERVLNVTALPSKYNTRVQTNGSSLKTGEESEVNIYINNHTNGAGNGLAGVKIVLDIKIKRAINPSLQTAIEGAEYTIAKSSVDYTEAFDVPNNIQGSLRRNFKFTPLVQGEFTITATLMHGTTKASTGTLTVRSAYQGYTDYLSTFNYDWKTNTGKLGFTYRGPGKEVADFGINFFAAIKEWDPTANSNKGAYVVVPSNTLIMEINGTPWYQFMGTLDPKNINTQEFDVTFKNSESLAGRRFEIGFLAHPANTLGTVGQMMTNVVVDFNDYDTLTSAMTYSPTATDANNKLSIMYNASENIDVNKFSFKVARVQQWNGAKNVWEDAKNTVLTWQLWDSATSKYVSSATFIGTIDPTNTTTAQEFKVKVSNSTAATVKGKKFKVTYNIIPYGGGTVLATETLELTFPV